MAIKKEIIILGSTGSIGKSTVEIIKKNPSNFNVLLLVSNKNYKLLYKQAVQLKSKYIYINDKSKSILLNKLIKNKKIKLLKNFNEINKIF